MLLVQGGGVGVRKVLAEWGHYSNNRHIHDCDHILQGSMPARANSKQMKETTALIRCPLALPNA